MKKIAIAYRIYPKISKVPAVFPDNKLALSEFCLASFARALEGINYKAWIILDSCPEEYYDLFRKYLKPDTELITVNGLKNPGTFKLQMDILMKQNFSDNIYFAEDDYFYLPEAIEEMLDFAASEFAPDFITPYDHKDYYTLDLHRFPKININYSDKRHWETEATTCMTFLTTKEILKETYDIFKTYTRRNYDASIWLAITKKKIFNPTIYPKYMFNDKNLFKVLGKTWFFTPHKLLFGHKYSLYAPKPSLGTHIEKKFLAPDVDWERHFEELKKFVF